MAKKKSKKSLKQTPKRGRLGGKEFFRENYRLSWKYLRESKNFVYATIIGFVFFILLGILIPIPPVLEQRILDLIAEILERTSGMSQGQLISFIFFNNLQTSFFGMIFGFFLGIFSFLTIAINGYLLGFVSEKVVQAEGIFILWRLFPHGIFELPALFISMGLGLKLGTFIFHKKKFKTFREFLWNSLRVFFFVVAPLLIIAAIVEGSLIVFAG